MFMYELLAQQFPFERQNLMHNQIEKLVLEGQRPSIQNKVIILVSSTTSVVYNVFRNSIIQCCF